MRPVTNLNIGNTFRSRNLNVRAREATNFIKVNPLNAPDLRKDIEEDKNKEGYTYLVFNDINEDEYLTKLLMTKGYTVDYYTSSEIGYQTLVNSANNKRVSFYYQLLKEFSQPLLKNIEKAQMLSRVVIDCPIIYPDIKYSQILFPVFDLRFMADQLEVSFPPLHKSELTYTKDNKQSSRAKHYKYNPSTKLYHLNRDTKLRYYLQMHEYLARWQIQLHIIADTPEEAKWIETKAKELVN